MLDVQIKPHRTHLMANQPGQKLFVALSLRPQQEAANARPTLATAFVVDTSGSMYEVVAAKDGMESLGETVTIDGQTYEAVKGGINKMEIMIDALSKVIDSSALQDKDEVTLVHFDDTANVLLPLTPMTQKAHILAAIEKLREHSGGTNMGAGMAQAFEILAKAQAGVKRMLLFTDGHTFDEELVQEMIQKLRAANISVTAIGIGDDWNEELLTSITDATQGRPFHVASDLESPDSLSVKTTELPSLVFDEIQHVAKEVVSNVELTIRTVKDVKLDRLTRIYPGLNEAVLDKQPLAVGNIEAGDWTVFMLEFTLPARAPAKLRLAQIGITYMVPGRNYRGEIPPQNLLVEYTNDAALAAMVDEEVMTYVQQRNVEDLVRRAATESRTDAEKARKTLQIAKTMTKKLGNTAMTQILDKAEQELTESNSISAGTVKTMRIGAKTKTMRIGEAESMLSEEQIRKLTGV